MEIPVGPGRAKSPLLLNWVFFLASFFPFALHDTLSMLPDLQIEQTRDLIYSETIDNYL